eukprot:2725493-Prymnesium_polylepis.1
MSTCSASVLRASSSGAARAVGTARSEPPSDSSLHCAALGHATSAVTLRAVWHGGATRHGAARQARGIRGAAAPLAHLEHMHPLEPLGDDLRNLLVGERPARLRAALGPPRALRPAPHRVPLDSLAALGLMRDDGTKDLTDRVEGCAHMRARAARETRARPATACGVAKWCGALGIGPV